LARTVKTLAKLASSTPTDLLISQGLFNVINLQRTVRTEILLSLFDSIDEPTRTNTTIAYSQICYGHLFSGVSPFSSRGLQIPCKDSRLPMLFRAIRPTLNHLTASLDLQVASAPPPTERSLRRIVPSLLALHGSHLTLAGFSTLTLRTLAVKILATHQFSSLEDISPLFGIPLCYDCAWLSLTALSTVTRNLWL
jgi:hypothetical protein